MPTKSAVQFIKQSYIVIMKENTQGKYWDSNPYLTLQNRVVLPTVPCKTTGIADKFH